MHAEFRGGEGGFMLKLYVYLCQMKNAYAEQKLKEQQQQVEDEARRERERLDELRRKEQERILEVGLAESPYAYQKKKSSPFPYDDCGRFPLLRMSVTNVTPLCSRRESMVCL